MSSPAFILPDPHSNVIPLHPREQQLASDAQRIAADLGHVEDAARLAPVSWYARQSSRSIGRLDAELLKCMTEMECRAAHELPPCTVVGGCRCGECSPAQGESPNGLAYAALPSNSPWGNLTLTDNAPNAEIHLIREQQVRCWDLGDYLMHEAGLLWDRVTEATAEGFWEACGIAAVIVVLFLLAFDDAHTYLTSQWQGFRSGWIWEDSYALCMLTCVVVGIVTMVSFLTYSGYMQ